MKRKLPLVFIVFIFLCLSPCAAFGFPAADNHQQGSITLELTYEGVPVTGGALTLYCLGQLVQAEDGDFVVMPAENFAMLEGVSAGALDPQLALELERYVVENALPGDRREVDSDGRVTFADLKNGLYFVMQPMAAEGFEKMKPFLITVPLWQDGSLIFDVVAQPKAQPQVPTEPAKPSLPQTGQLSWPVPLIGSLGICLLAVGGILCFRRKRDGNET